MATLIGLDAKFYINGGTEQTPSWGEVSAVRDVRVSLESGEIDLARRGSTWRKFRAGLKEATLEIELLYDPSDANIGTLRDAYVNGTVVDVAAADGDIASAGYFRILGNVTKWENEQPLEEGSTVSVTIRPADGQTDPSFN